MDSSRDNTPFTPAQLEWLPKIYRDCSGIWHESRADGVSIDRIPGRFGDIFSLSIDGLVWMCTNPSDYLDHRRILTEARGKVLLTGLGLGMGLVFCSMNPAVEAATVVEKDPRVANAVMPMLSNLNLAVDLVVADADEFIPDGRYDFAYIDHAYAQPPPSTVERLSMSAEVAVTWWDEFQEVMSSWR